ncbi:MAG: hypothetical protein K6T55_07125 [Syntrophobacterales bacterium]|jgi:hypothetical protein|nr:hypothetical protein [Syntrophobacterales bacterium]
MSPWWNPLTHTPGIAPSLLLGLVGWLVWRLRRQRDQRRLRQRIVQRLSSV